MKRYEFIRAESANFTVRELCRNLGVARSAFYEWAECGASAKARDDERLLTEIRAVHKRSRERYGAPRVHQALRASGHRVSRKRVARLMRDAGLRARPRRRFRRTTDSSHKYPVAPNVLQRNFSAAAPNEAWVGDITYIWTAEGWSYLAVLIDLFSRRVVGWAMRSTLSRELCLAALEQALTRRRPKPGLVDHTDRGSQYASHGYRRVLDDNEVVCSMSRTGDCWDNAPAESFFATLKKELVHGCAFATRTEAYDAIGDYIENFYNAERLHSSLGYISPNSFEILHRVGSAA